MNNLNTTKKGDAFEKQVYDLFSELLLNDELFVNGKRSKIFWKKSYHSNKTNANVQVDISIETYLKDANDYSFLTIIECKNYSSSVVINDIREFSSILNELGEHNTKGILITTSAFQQGAYEFAVSSKIGLARVDINNEIDWISYRKDHKYHVITNEEIKQNLYSNSLKETNFFSFYNKKCFEKLPALLEELSIIDNYKNKLQFLAVPYCSESKIESEVSNLPSDLIYDDTFLNTDKLCNYLSEKYDVTFTFDQSLNGNILGKICFDPLVISVSDKIANDIYRWRFTLAHEIGHLILHKDLLKKYIDEKTDDEDSLSSLGNDHTLSNNRLEIQANKFASRLLLPQRQFIQAVNEYFIKENINKGYIYFDRQPVNLSLVHSLFRELQYKFGVSKEVSKFRLIDLNLLKDATHISIKRVLRDDY